MTSLKTLRQAGDRCFVKRARRFYTLVARFKQLKNRRRQGFRNCCCRLTTIAGAKICAARELFNQEKPGAIFDVERATR